MGAKGRGGGSGVALGDRKNVLPWINRTSPIFQ